MRIIMMGTGPFAEPTFQALLDTPELQVVALVTNPDRPSGKDRVMERPIKRLARSRQIPVFQPDSPNTPESVATLRQGQPDLLVVADYGHILSADVLNTAKLGGINVHGSLLPKYRGAAPIVWAILQGEQQAGVTIIRMSTKLDAGHMLAQEALDILPDETAGQLEARLAPLGAKLALQVIAQLAAGTAEGIPQDTSAVTKAPKLKKEQGLIDWTQPSDQICRHIRAMQPWPTAYTYWHRPNGAPLRLQVIQAQRLPVSTRQRPGYVAHVTPDMLGIAAGDGTVLSLVRIQPAGKKEMPVADFLRGHHVEVGQRFGAEHLA
jgi:methionyl-tRNA formyltransferase